MTERMELGKRGENYACGYLVDKGYKVIARNHRETWGELDIVARARDKTLVFVEVKTMCYGGALGLVPEDQMSSAKMKKFRRTAELYANAHADLIKERVGWRLDVLALLENGSSFEVHHYENVS